MNRQWMYGDRHTSEYVKGVHNFLEVAEANKQNGTCNLTRLEELQSRHHMQHATTYHAAKLEQAPAMLV